MDKVIDIVLRLSWIQRIKDWMRKNQNSNNPITRCAARRLWDCISILREIKGILASKRNRSVFWTKLLHADSVHQTTPATAFNRYPVIFTACQDYFQNRTNLRILSFGCSTGEEVLTLRHYFPDATIVGAEINQYSLEIARKRCQDKKMICIESTSVEIEKHGPYDAAFCMAVFQRTPQLIAECGIKDLSRIYPFHRFEKQICQLDKCINKDGLLVIHFSQYDFADTSVAHKYQAYGSYNQDCYGPFVFGKDSKLVPAPKSRNSIFVKTTD